MGSKKDKSNKPKNEPIVITSKDGKITSVFHGGVGEIIEVDEIKGGIHLTLDSDFWNSH